MRAILAALLVLALPGSALAAAGEGQAPNPGADKDKVICKREVPVGSLIASRKMCFTKSQWQKRAEEGNAQARALVQGMAGACGQNGGVCPF